MEESDLVGDSATPGEGREGGGRGGREEEEE